MSSKTFETIIYKKEEGIAKIIINRPDQRNALNLKLMLELEEVLYDAEFDDNVRVILLRGSGDKAFCAGADLEMINSLTADPNLASKMLGHFIRIVQTMKDCGKPVVAAVNGLAIGGAGELLVAVDIIIASDHAKFILGEAAVGATPVAGTTQWLTPIIGDKRARMLLLTDEAIDAQTALEWGLINKVVPGEKLDEEADILCKKLLNKSKWAVRFAKSQINAWLDLVYNTFTQGKDFWVLEAVLPDLRKSSRAFMDKKPIDWISTNREQFATKSEYYYWGPPVKKCKNCGTRDLPQNHKYCGMCGGELND